MPKKVYVLLSISYVPFNAEALRRVSNHNCLECVSATVEVKQLERGGFGASITEIDPRVTQGTVTGPEGQGSTEESAVADMLMHHLCSQKSLAVETKK
ncbi:MAG: hypothetical protein WD509_00200 [Candidatus Paceibacterota bacterium]